MSAAHCWRKKPPRGSQTGPKIYKKYKNRDRFFVRFSDLDFYEFLIVFFVENRAKIYDLGENFSKLDFLKNMVLLRRQHDFRGREVPEKRKIREKASPKFRSIFGAVF